MSRDIAILRTDRLLLRPLRLSDASALVDGVGNYDVSKWLSVVPFPYDDSDALGFIASKAAQPRVTWAICDMDGLQGVISIDGEFGFWLNRRVWGQGYATEAGRAAVDAAFADPTRKGLRAGCKIGNDRSARVLDKLGFRIVATSERMFRAFGQTAPAAELWMTRADWRCSRGLSPRRWWSIAQQLETPEAPQ